MIAACRAGGGRRSAALHRLARWLGLAAAPVFAAMALLGALPSGAPPEAICASGHGSALHGMVPMYGLMAAFHAASWLRLAAGAGRATLRS